MNATSSSTTLSVADIQAEAAGLLAQSNNLFVVHTASHWIEQARHRPTPQMLFSEFWFEGELCILFADTNQGKSILAVQIGDSISRGVAIPGFKLQSPAQPVLYFDFELTDKQFESRYSADYDDHYHFHPNFYRAELNADADVPGQYTGFEDYMNLCLEQTIVATGARVLIIDNLTYLKSETEKARDALPLMKHLKALKQRYNLSILALAHTPKRDMSKPMTRNDLQGSKMLINFCDTAFAIGESTAGKNMRYLKQVKQRYTESIYDAGNVVICETTKPGNFLQFSFIGYGTEYENLTAPEETDRESYRDAARQLKAQGYTQREIAQQLGLSLGAVNKYIK